MTVDVFHKGRIDQEHCGYDWQVNKEEAILEIYYDGSTVIKVRGSHKELYNIFHNLVQDIKVVRNGR